MTDDKNIRNNFSKALADFIVEYKGDLTYTSLLDSLCLAIVSTIFSCKSEEEYQESLDYVSINIINILDAMQKNHRSKK